MGPGPRCSNLQSGNRGCRKPSCPGLHGGRGPATTQPLTFSFLLSPGLRCHFHSLGTQTIQGQEVGPKKGLSLSLPMATPILLPPAHLSRDATAWEGGECSLMAQSGAHAQVPHSRASSQGPGLPRVAGLMALYLASPGPCQLVKG